MFMSREGWLGAERSRSKVRVPNYSWVFAVMYIIISTE